MCLRLASAGLFFWGVMATFTPAAAYWTAVLAASGDSARATAVADLLTTGTKLKFYDSGSTLIRTVTTAAWTKGAVSVGSYPITPGAFTGSQTGTGTPATVVVTASDDTEIFRTTAGVLENVFQIPSAFATSVDLSEGSFTLNYPTADAAPSGKRWHPGHYFYTSQDWTHDITMVESRRNKVRTNPYFQGYKLYAFWDKLESTAGVYDFSAVLTELDKAEADGKYVLIRLEERSFHGAARGLPCPQYVYDGGGTYAHVGNGQNILSPKLWVPWVGEAYLAMVAALMDAIDDHPALQCVMTEECSIEGAWLQPGYTWQAMNAFILEYCRVGSAGAVNSLWHQNMGWSNEPSSDTTEHYRMTDTVVRTHKAGISPTDLNILTSWMATKNTTYGKYIYDRYLGETFFAPNVEYQSYVQAGHTAKSLLDFGVDTLGAHFIAWSNTDYGGSWAFTQEDAIAEVTRQAGRINTARPSNVPV